jgi:hypothetical protein
MQLVSSIHYANHNLLRLGQYLFIACRRPAPLQAAGAATVPPSGAKGLLTFRGKVGVSGACPGESSRPGHPKGPKRQSGWDVGTALNARTRELAFEERRSGLWLAVVVGANRCLVERWGADFIRSANWLYRRTREE